MDRKTFENIYQNKLTGIQKEHLHLCLAGHKNSEIAKILNVDCSLPSQHLKRIAKEYGLVSESSPYSRGRLVELFIKYKRELVSLEILKKYGYAVSKITFPQGAEPLNSLLYQNRGDLEANCYKYIKNTGTLIRIKGASKTGKTSLIKRIVADAKENKNHAVYLNFSLIDRHRLTNSNDFFRSFYAYIVNQIIETPKLEPWNKDLCNTLNCENQMKKLLRQIPTGLVLALDEVDKLFEHPDIYQNFFPMLRSWNEKANESEIWEKLRIVVAHSTEDYGRLDINQSPFNIGLPIQLDDFSDAEVLQLAIRHGLESKVVNPIMDLVGGHPYLVRLAFYYLATENISYHELLKYAATDNGIYSQHLANYLDIFQNNPELIKTFQPIICGQENIKKNIKNRIRIHQLEALGLIKLDGNFVVPRCRLYSDYFKQCFS